MVQISDVKISFEPANKELIDCSHTSNEGVDHCNVYTKHSILKMRVSGKIQFSEGEKACFIQAGVRVSYKKHWKEKFEASYKGENLRWSGDHQCGQFNIIVPVDLYEISPPNGSVFIRKAQLDLCIALLGEQLYFTTSEALNFYSYKTLSNARLKKSCNPEDFKYELPVMFSLASEEVKQWASKLTPTLPVLNFGSNKSPFSLVSPSYSSPLPPAPASFCSPLPPVEVHSGVNGVGEVAPISDVKIGFEPANRELIHCSHTSHEGMDHCNVYTKHSTLKMRVSGKIQFSEGENACFIQAGVRVSYRKPSNEKFEASYKGEYLRWSGDHQCRQFNIIVPVDLSEISPPNSSVVIRNAQLDLCIALLGEQLYFTTSEALNFYRNKTLSNDPLKKSCELEYFKYQLPVMFSFASEEVKQWASKLTPTLPVLNFGPNKSPFSLVPASSCSPLPPIEVHPLVNGPLFALTHNSLTPESVSEIVELRRMNKLLEDQLRMSRMEFSRAKIELSNTKMELSDMKTDAEKLAKDNNELVKKVSSLQEVIKELAEDNKGFAKEVSTLRQQGLFQEGETKKRKREDDVCPGLDSNKKVQSAV